MGDIICIIMVIKMKAYICCDCECISEKKIDKCLYCGCACIEVIEV
jgi:hypothetical protein